MQGQKIQNNSYNPNFGARLRLKGYTNDIDKKTIKTWRDMAKNVAYNADIITIEFSEPKYVPHYSMLARDYIESCPETRRDVVATAIKNTMTHRYIDEHNLGHQSWIRKDVMVVIKKNIENFFKHVQEEFKWL